MSDDFETALIEYLAPRLRPLDYSYEARLRLGAELFGFRKALDNGVQALIQFQRQADGTAERFTVNLIRARESEIQPRPYGGDDRARGARLSYVLWFVHDRRDYSVSDYWWTVTDFASREAALLDAGNKLVRFGIPWLEDPNPARPWEMPLDRGDEFAEAVQAMMAREMERLGYRLERQSLAGDQPYCYFSKPMPDETFALIELQPTYGLEPGEFSFDVRLQRRADNDPLAFSGDYGHWRSASLAQLVHQARDGTPLDQLSVSGVKTLVWRYHNRVELDAQLLDALEHIKRIGCAWVEQTAAKSKVIQ